MEVDQGQESFVGDDQQTTIFSDCDITKTVEVDGNLNEDLANIVSCTIISEPDRNTAISEFIANPDTLVYHQLQPPEAKKQNNIKNEQDEDTSITPITWEEVFSIEVFPVRCKDTNAELYKSKFASGTKGKSIKFNDEWFTPHEFESLCGRASSKDWKRSIRFGGRPLQALVQIGCLMPHAFSCICSKCVDNSSPAVPIRHFAPYQRKRKNLQQGDSSMLKLSKNSNADESSDAGTSSRTNQLTQILNKISKTARPTTKEAWRNLQDMVEKIVQASLLMNKMVKDAKEQNRKEIESLKSQLQEQQKAVQSLKEQLNQRTMDGIAHSLIQDPEFVKSLESSRTKTFSIKVVDPATIKQLQASQPTAAIKSEPEGQR